MKKFNKAYHFIDDHPALISDVFRTGILSIEVRVYPVCKRELGEYDPIFIYPEDDRFEEFSYSKHKSHNEKGEVVCISAHYKDFYGEDWVMDHICVEISGCITRYARNEFPEFDHIGDDNLSVTASSYEEAIIKLADNLWRHYGDYSRNQSDENTIVPKWIIENNKIHRPYTPETLKEGWLNRNPKYIGLKPEEISEIWWQIFKPNKRIPNKKLVEVSQYLKGDK